jgi:hypothetical protein
MKMVHAAVEIHTTNQNLTAYPVGNGVVAVPVKTETHFQV